MRVERMVITMKMMMTLKRIQMPWRCQRLARKRNKENKKWKHLLVVTLASMMTIDIIK
jgi:hypothetical protein